MALADALLQLTNAYSLLRIALKDHAKDAVQLIRQWKNGLQEIRILGECLVGGILTRSLLPRVPATCQVDKNNS